MVPRVSVIILNYNGKQYLNRCFDALLAQTYNNFEILFIDNASQDNSVDHVKEQYGHEVQSGKIRIIRNHVNKGFAEGNNIGWRAARGEFVVLLNNDTRPNKRWLHELVRAMSDHPEIMVCGSAYYDTGKRAQWEELFLKRKESTTMNLAGEAVPSPRKTLGDPELLAAFFVSGNGTILRRRQFDRPFFKPYFAYAEDTYLGWLANLRGGKVAYHLGARMEHLGGGTKRISTTSFMKELLFHGNKNQMMNPLLFYERWTLLRVMPLLALSQLGHVVDNPRKIFIKLRATWWIFTHLPTVLSERHKIQRSRKVRDFDILPQMSCVFYDERMAKSQYNPIYRCAIAMINRLSKAYCWVARLRVQESSNPPTAGRTPRVGRAR